MRSQKIDRNCTAKRKHGSGSRPLKIRTCMTAAPKATFRRDRNAGETLHHHTNQTKGRLEPKMKHRPRKKMNRGSLTAPTRSPETGGSETISRFDGDFVERGWKKGVCVDKRGVDCEVGDGRVVDRGCVYMDAFDKGVDRRTMGDRSVELSSILNIVNCPRLLYSDN
ncbi:unnamed protein product [Brassica napus]|uniref:(rape) hypothetical protein n=1 Tax=Brassica napus TaxID=3708 RepID=A0A816LN49_BRANA|nr:unnamed protein product [Brassica napus]